MCHQVTYTLTCEHVKTQTIYCADATVISSAGISGSSNKLSQSPLSKHKSKSSSSSSSSSKQKSSSTHHSLPKAPKRPCVNLSVQALPYPTPPSYAADPASFFASPLSPRCPLAGDCPFEQKNRCWNCCWCGKAWNETGRCGCVMLIDGSEVQCEHICCLQCEPAGGGGWESSAGYA